MTVEATPEAASNTPVTELRGLNPATADAHAQGFAGVVRQIGVRHGRGAALTEAAGLIMASAFVLARLCGPECVRDTMAWFAGRAALPLGPEAEAPFPLTDDGIALPDPRPLQAASHHAVRSLLAIARDQGASAALELTCGALRAGVAVLREMTDTEVLALLLERYATAAATAAVMDPEEIAATMPEQVH